MTIYFSTIFLIPSAENITCHDMEGFNGDEETSTEQVDKKICIQIC